MFIQNTGKAISPSSSVLRKFLITIPKSGKEGGQILKADDKEWQDFLRQNLNIDVGTSKIAAIETEGQMFTMKKQVMLEMGEVLKVLFKDKTKVNLFRRCSTCTGRSHSLSRCIVHLPNSKSKCTHCLLA